MNGTSSQSTWRNSHPQSPTPDQIRRRAAAIRQEWAPYERVQRQQVAAWLQRRLIKAAVQSAA